MSELPIEMLLGTGDPDPGCDGASEVFEQYIEAIRRGEDARLRYPECATHIRNCAACREDAEGLLAALELLDQPPPPE